ncbi:hypothetical protein AJ79_05519 [Helicocarpus griseus UAMH5409]|uniref:BZIP domain-containing protein n=1 Tax=Helicocarpus griseus UAMH5409 TaxID=1447875 RepID=A0A2B7XET1_9EURO|nr:hypothetical protein AJ79_05519 [Helicocarpus griseus UAMH5409]
MPLNANSDLDILSASIFTEVSPESHGTHPHNGSSSRILYGGLEFHNDGGMYEDTCAIDEMTNASTEEDMCAPSQKKQKRRSNSGGGDSSRKRGRPRLDTRDETAAERRRTQIRLAQRAYRSRKDAAISVLNQRVAELEDTVEQMARSFLTFNDEAMDSDLLSSRPELAQQLRRVTERFISLTKRSLPGSDCEGSSLSILNHSQATPPSYPSNPQNLTSLYLAEKGKMTLGYNFYGFEDGEQTTMPIRSCEDVRDTLAAQDYSYGLGQNEAFAFRHPSLTGKREIHFSVLNLKIPLVFSFG